MKDISQIELEADRAARARVSAELGVQMDEFGPDGERIAWGREESDPDGCERGTFGCSVRHTRSSSECATW